MKRGLLKKASFHSDLRVSLLFLGILRRLRSRNHRELKESEKQELLRSNPNQKGQIFWQEIVGQSVENLRQRSEFIVGEEATLTLRNVGID